MQRSEIISAAAQIFRVKGYQAASMQDIADAVHLQKASLYHHVESKQEILLTILNQALDLLIADMQVVLGSDLPSDEKLREAIRVYVSRLDEKITSFALLGIQNWMITWSRRSGGLKAEALAEIFTNLVLQGMSPRQGSIGQ